MQNDQIQDSPTNDFSFEPGRQKLKIGDARSNPGANLGIMFEDLEGTDYFWNTAFLSNGPPIKIMKNHVTMLYEAVGLEPYQWTDPSDTNEGYAAIMELVGKVVDVRVGKRGGAGRKLPRSEIREIFIPQKLPTDPILPDDNISHLFGEPAPETTRDGSGRLDSDDDFELDLNDDAVWYHWGLMMNRLAELHRETYRLTINHHKKSATNFQYAKKKLLEEIKAIEKKLLLTPTEPE